MKFPSAYIRNNFGIILSICWLIGIVILGFVYIPYVAAAVILVVGTIISVAYIISSLENG